MERWGSKFSMAFYRLFYFWNNNDTLPYIENLSTGNYSLTVVDADGCEKVFDIEVISPPAIQINIDVTNETAQNEDGAIAVMADGGVPPYTFSWSSDPDQTGNSIANLPAGEYEVTVTDSNGCEEDAIIIIDRITSTWDIDAINSFEISPNPNNGSFTILLDTGKSDSWLIQITDMHGKVLNQIKNSSIPNGSEEINMELPPGVYNISFNSGNNLIKAKTVIVH
jgi:hypothetical protein